MNNVPAWWRRALAWLWPLASTLWMAACAAPPGGLFPPAEDEPVVPIWLVSHGWHAGIVIERAAIPSGLLPEQADFPEARYLEIGWGDRAYYMHPDPHWGILLKAGLWPTASVLHVTGLRDAPQRAFPHSTIIRIATGREGFEQLCQHLDARFARNGEPARALQAGLYGDSRFYPSTDSYHLFNTCNVWTTRVLHAAGCPVTPAFNITVDSLLSSVAATCGERVTRPE
ncbi:DUF2459 domain-containing protein [Thiohalophilus sp.]|uniref:DUF2459 domain-containing protein n=1 Tax=Thiohalophilus sp. TaxID=3028392 RepID=UPI002ACDC34A|nr:DUF2459 domain-containing protein [Thiohalophilus sp.]MDZ7660964.1 DUF2459 domain-containing protein [Thiohalophilus sp.]